MVTIRAGARQPQQAQPLGWSEIAAVLLTIQGSLTLAAGLLALPFGIVEPGMRVEGLLTVLLAAGCFLLARGVRRGSRWARRCVLGFEGFSIVATGLLWILPIGAVRGPVPLLANLVLQAAVFFLVLKHRAA